MAGIYWNDIKTILEPGVGCMSQQPVATDEGVFVVHLDDYDSVCRLHAVIMAALNAWERDDSGKAWKKNSEGRPIPTKTHPMPPGDPLPIENVDTFITWVDDGMPENPPAAIA